MNTLNNRGGQANEGGSLHRAGIADYLAVHGLFGQPVSQAGFAEGDPFPTKIYLETEDSVDDIKCVMSDGSSWFIQAKRTCGKDAALRSTVSQWATQQLGDDDRLGLAVGVLKGEVKELGYALDKKRRGSRLLKPERASIKAVKASFPDRTPDATKNDVLRIAHVLEIQAERDRDSGSAEMGRWMAGKLVPEGAGAKAFDYLRKHFQHLAAEAGGSGLDDWVGVLQEAGIAIYPEAGGAPAARRVAEAEAVQAYRLGLALRADSLNYSLFSDDVVPLKIQGLVNGITVKYRGPFEDRDVEHELKQVVRRSSRFILRGLPGSGKSVALEQIAANLARDAGAPVPVLVPLRRLSQEDPDSLLDLDLRGLISKGMDVQNHPGVVEGLVESMASGHAVLLLDGLDETFRRRAVVADVIKRLASELHKDCGLVVATRDAALGAAGRLHIPFVTLDTPKNLQEILTQLLTRFAESDVPAGRKNAWLKSRTAWLRESIQFGHPLWKVPLTAALMTLAAMRSEVPNVPLSRAVLLCRGLEESVKRWESQSPRSEDWAPELRPAMLLGTFAVVANLFSDQGTVSVAEAEGAVSSYLQNAWGLAPAAALEVREQCLHFWNESVGVLLISENGIEPRHRQLVEVGQAMWIKGQSAEVQTAWLRQALNYSELRESVALALQLSSEIKATFVQIACDPSAPVHARALEWMVGWCRDGTLTLESGVGRLLAALTRAAAEEIPKAKHVNTGLDDIRSLIARGEDGIDERDGVGWYWVHQLATLHLADAEEQNSRMRCIQELELNEEKGQLATALALLTDHMSSSEVALTPDLVNILSPILSRSLPQTVPAPEKRSRKAPTVIVRQRSILTGYGELAWRVSPFVESFPVGFADDIYALAKYVSFRHAGEIRANLRRSGFEDPEHNALDQSTLYKDAMADFMKGWRCILSAISNQPTGTVSDAAESWRVIQLCRILDAIGYDRFSSQDLYGVLEDSPELLVGWVVALGHAHGIDMSIASAQALAATSDLDKDSDHADIFSLIMTTPLILPDRPNPENLTAVDLEALVVALGSASASVRHSAARLLVDSHGEGVSEQVRSCMPNIPARGRPLAAKVVCALGVESVEVVRDLLEDDNDLVRLGAAEFSKIFEDADPAFAAISEEMQSHDDMTVRIASGAPQQSAEQARYWTCRDCGSRNSIADLDCEYCSSGARPGKHG